MDEYLKLLTLTYFKQYSERYVLSDLIKILGISIKKLHEILAYLMKESLIEYVDDLLTLTEKGHRILINKNLYEFTFSESDYLSFKIDTLKAWPLDKPYVPLKFLTKI